MILLHKYYSLDFIMKRKIRQIKQLLAGALNKSSEEKHFQLYVAMYPNMTEENYIPFEEFYKPQTQVKVEEKSATEILLEVKEIMNSNTWR